MRRQNHIDVTAGTAALAVGLLLPGLVAGHEHKMNNVVPGKGVSQDPIDSILWIHILTQALAWGVLFPTGMVLGIIRSRWHVPIQSFAALLTILGYFLGHAHKGRQFAPSAHSTFAPFLYLMLFSQVGLGIYLKLHLSRGLHGRIRRWIVLAHGVLGKALPVAAWVQMLFGGIAALGFCRDDHLGQCLAHFIMGSAFIGYGILLLILLLVGQAWLRRTGRSQEFFDSAIIAAWGCVNTFTEHRWGQPWVHNDLQHTSMGIIWWCAGLLGLWLSRARDGSPRRNLIPGMVVLLTGYAMSGHPQTLMISTMTHAVFGYTLMAAGLARMIEISFVLRDKPAGDEPSSFQFLPPFLLVAGGFMFMGATEEQMKLLDENHVDHISYMLLLYSIAFLLYLFVNLLIRLYANTAMSLTPKPLDHDDPESGTPHANGHALPTANGQLAASGLARDAQDFELEGLISGDEDERSSEEDSLAKEEVSPGSSVR